MSFTPQPLMAVGVIFHPWFPDGRAGSGKKFVRCSKLIHGRDID